MIGYLKRARTTRNDLAKETQLTKSISLSLLSLLHPSIENASQRTSAFTRRDDESSSTTTTTTLPELNPGADYIEAT
jgi:hypothetical protein